MSKTQTQTKPTTTQAAQPAEAQATPLLDQVLEQTARKIDLLAGRYSKAIAEAPGHMERAFLLAEGIDHLRQAITPEVMRKVMRLMNHKNGFMTDRGTERSKIKEPYSEGVVKECFITSLLHGLYPVGNEWNIIAGDCFVAQNGWRRKFEEIPGISDIDVVPGVPRNADGHALVRVAIAWKLHGQANALRDHEGKPGVVFPIALTQYSSSDQVIGKALRRAYRLAYQKATGSTCTLPDGEVGDGGSVPLEAAGLTPTGQPASRTQQIADRLGVTRSAPPPQGMLLRIRGILEALDFQEEEWIALAERNGAPADLTRATEEQARAVLQELETIQRQAAEEAAAERSAVQGG